MLQAAISPLVQPLRARSGARTPRDTTWPALQRASFENSNNPPPLEATTPPPVTEAPRVHRQAASGQLLRVWHDSGWRGSRQPVGGVREATVSAGPATMAAVLSFPALAGPHSGVTPTAWLRDALTSLRSCAAEALDDGLEQPSEVALSKAELLLRQLAPHLAAEPDVYAMDGSSIALDWRNTLAASGVLLVVEADGAAVLYSRTRKSKGRIRVDEALDLVEEGALEALRKVGIQ